MPLNEEQVEQLEDILFSDSLNDEALDYFGLHGLVTAATVGPESVSESDMLMLLTGSDDENLLSSDERSILFEYIQLISTDIQTSISEGTEIHLPYMDETNNENNTHYDACLESWCIGFMEGFFHSEKAWFTKGEDVAAELLLPIMALSGLFDSDEFIQIRSNNKLTSQFEEIMPEQIVDIFLFYHSD